MRSRYRISVSGVQMDTLDDNLLILDIGYQQPDMNRKTQTSANLNGISISDTHVGQGRVTVTFELHIYDTAERNAVCQNVNKWASAGGTLRTSDREDQELERVVCEQFADISSARNWTDPLTIVFATTSNPYWISRETDTVVVTGSGSGSLPVSGNVGKALVSLTATANAAVTSYQAVVGSTKVKLTGISVPSGKTVVVDYVDGRYMRIRANGSSVMPKLDKTSTDNLLANCGKSNSVSVTANAKVSTTFTARGCWLW